MYTGSLRAASNRAEWQFSVELTDPDTDLPIDLTGALIEIAVRDQQSRMPLLPGSSASGKIAIPVPATGGAFTVTFPKTDMATLCANMFDVGLRVSLASGRNYQLIVATLPVVDGVVDT